MSAVGPNAPTHLTVLIPRCCVQTTISTADIAVSTLLTCGAAARVIPQSAGTVYLQLAGDVASCSYVAVAGQAIDGEVILIGGTTTGSTAMKINVMV